MVSEQTALSAEEAYQRIRAYLMQNDPLGSFGSSKIQWDDAQRRAALAGSGFTAEIRVQTLQQGAQVEFNFKPSFLLKAFTSKVESLFLVHLQKALNSSPPVV